MDEQKGRKKTGPDVTMGAGLAATAEHPEAEERPPAGTAPPTARDPSAATLADVPMLAPIFFDLSEEYRDALPADVRAAIIDSMRDPTPEPDTRPRHVPGSPVHRSPPASLYNAPESLPADEELPVRPQGGPPARGTPPSRLLGRSRRTRGGRGLIVPPSRPQTAGRRPPPVLSPARFREVIDYTKVPPTNLDADTTHDETPPAPPEDPDSFHSTDFCATDLGGGYTVNELILDLNGSSGFSEDKVSLGTVPTSHYLQVTRGLNLPMAFHLGVDPFVSEHVPKTSEEYQKRVMLFVWANFRALMDSGLQLSAEHATFLALLRLNVVTAGGVAEDPTARAIYVDEYEYVDYQYEDAVLGDLRITKDLIRYISDSWLQYVALVRHVFITRGHHYKQEYDELIRRTWNATTIEPPTGLPVPSWLHILRTGLHCFGIRSVHLLVLYGNSHGRLAASFETRLHAASAGTAPIRTGWAVILNMKQAMWWPDFYKAYKEQVDALERANAVLVRYGVRAHINARLFNFEWSRILVDDAPVRALAPLMLGFLDILDANESIRGQKTLNKRGDGGSAIRVAFSMVLSNEARNAKFMQTVREYFQQMETTGGARVAAPALPGRAT